MENKEVNMRLQLHEPRKYYDEDGWDNLIIDVKQFEKQVKLAGYTAQSDFIYENHISLNIDGKFWLSEEHENDFTAFNCHIPKLPKGLKAKQFISFLQPQVQDSTVIYYDQYLQKFSDQMNQTGQDNCFLAQASVDGEGYKFFVKLNIEHVLAIRTTSERVIVSIFTIPEKVNTDDSIIYTISEQILLSSILNEKELKRCEYYNDYATQIWHTLDLHNKKLGKKVNA